MVDWYMLGAADALVRVGQHSGFVGAVRLRRVWPQREALLGWVSGGWSAGGEPPMDADLGWLSTLGASVEREMEWRDEL
jgi:hypothetical protein